MRDKSKYTAGFLAQEFGCNVDLIEALCAMLNRHGFIATLGKDGSTEEWSLVCDSATITLGDVFAAVTESSELFQGRLIQTVAHTEKAREAELLVSQAALDVNEFIQRRLKQFCLLSLKAHTSRSFLLAGSRTFT